MIIALVLLAHQIFGPGSPMVELVMLPIYIAIFYLVGVAVYRAQRYRLSRTTWRGIRGALTGSPWSYGWTFLWTTLLVVPTLGWSVPWQSTKLQKLLVEDMRFGDEPLRFTATSGPLYGPYAVLWVGIISLYLGVGYLIFRLLGEQLILSQQTGIPLGPTDLLLMFAIIFVAMFIYSLISAFYTSKLYNHFFNNTHIQTARFSLRTTPLSLIWLIFTNTLLVLVTLGIATPIVQARLAGYFVRRMEIDGQIDFDSIAQSQAQLQSTGEGLAEAFDIDAF